VTNHAIILAAGKGSRLEPDEGHKLLVEIDGRTMLDRHLANFQRLGVTDVTVVVGWEHRALQRDLEAHEVPEGMTVHTAINPAFEGSLGLSVLVGADQASRNSEVDAAVPFWLTMSDHIYEPALFERLADTFETERPEGTEAMLAVDGEIEAIFDVPDATKLRVDAEGNVEEVGKKVEEFDWADTGLFWCDQGFVDALDELRRERGDGFKTAAAVHALDERGALWLWDVGEARWQDVDTPEARRHAEAHADWWRPG
jgi:choline kinase